MEILNPYTQKNIGEISLLQIEDVERVVNQAKAVKFQMKSLSSKDRSGILLEINSGIEKRYEELVNTIIAESGKPYRYASAEVDRAIQTFTFAAEEAKRLPHELLDLDSSAKGKGLKGEVVYYPIGIVFGISPFNFPLNLAAHKIAPALATGCPIILKPSSKTPLTMELIAAIISETSLPEGAFQLAHCSRATGNKFIQHKDIDLLSFTGSPTVGWEMKANAGKKKVVLELGGNAAAIVCKDANIESAVEALMVGGFAYSGQVCIHTQRIYVHNSNFDAFVTQFLNEVNKLEIGDPKEKDTEFSVMIDEQNAERTEQWVQEALDDGADLLVGHKREKSLYYPTVLSRVQKGAKVRDEEVFGPVVIIEPFDELNAAIEEVNDSKWGLQAAIFTNSIDARDEAFEKLNVGGVIHNLSTTFRVDDMPYGGIKDSGFGREGVRYAMKDYLEPKLLVRKG
jgi:glyceraldehyde-3-phosphate dehydrogenase (NADP+)